MSEFIHGKESNMERARWVAAVRKERLLPYPSLWVIDKLFFMKVKNYQGVKLFICIYATYMQIRYVHICQNMFIILYEHLLIVLLKFSWKLSAFTCYWGRDYCSIGAVANTMTSDFYRINKKSCIILATSKEARS